MTSQSRDTFTHMKGTTDERAPVMRCLQRAQKVPKGESWLGHLPSLESWYWYQSSKNAPVASLFFVFTFAVPALRVRSLFQQGGRGRGEYTGSRGPQPTSLTIAFLPAPGPDWGREKFQLSIILEVYHIGQNILITKLKVSLQLKVTEH